MILKGAKQLKNFKKGINLYVPKRVASIITYANGLYGKRYVGDFEGAGSFVGNVNWFNTATLHGDVNQLTSIDDFTSAAEAYSWQWLRVLLL
jgi:hypothetical protein